MKNSKKQLNKLTSPNDPDEELVREAPSFSEGIGNIKNHIINKVLSVVLGDIAPKFAIKKAKKIGHEDGYAGGENNSYQPDCLLGYQRIVARLDGIIAKIIKRERDEAHNILRTDLPNMQDTIKQRIDPGYVQKRVTAANELVQAQKNVKNFLFQRGLTFEQHTAQRGESHEHWKFWLPLLVILVVEAFCNYIFLEPAKPLEKTLITVTVISVIFVCGYAISWCFKALAGVRVVDNKFKRLHKNLAWAGIVVLSVVFAAALLLFIFYRAGMSFISVSGMWNQLAEAFTNNPTDFGLAVLNIVFLFLAISTFKNAGWCMWKYRKMAEKMETCNHKYESSVEYAAAQVKEIFHGATHKVKQLESRANNIKLNWHAIQSVFDKISDIHSQAVKIISEQYERAIKQYRNAFEQAFSPSQNDDMTATIPAEITCPIQPLEKIDKSAHSKIEDLREMDIANEVDKFRKRVEQWYVDNNDIEKLERFADKHIKRTKQTIAQQRNADLRMAPAADE